MFIIYNNNLNLKRPEKINRNFQITTWLFLINSMVIFFEAVFKLCFLA